MKKIISGIGLLLTAVILFIKIHEIAVNYYPKLNNWSISAGKYFSSVDETSGTIPFIISLIIGILGLIFIFWGCFENQNNSKNTIIKKSVE